METLLSDMIDFGHSEARINSFVNEIIKRHVDDYYCGTPLWKETLNAFMKVKGLNEDMLKRYERLQPIVVNDVDKRMRTIMNNLSMQLIGRPIIQEVCEENIHHSTSIRITVTKYIDKISKYIGRDVNESQYDLRIIIDCILNDYFMYIDSRMRERLFFSKELKLIKSVIDNQSDIIISFRLKGVIHYMIPVDIDYNNNITCVLKRYGGSWHESIVQLRKMSDVKIVSHKRSMIVPQSITEMIRLNVHKEHLYELVDLINSNRSKVIVDKSSNDNRFSARIFSVKIVYHEYGEQGYIIKANSIVDAVRMLNDVNNMIDLKMTKFYGFPDRHWVYKDRYLRCNIKDVSGTNIINTYNFDYPENSH